MPIIQCPQGHFYDDRKFRECPHCGRKEDIDSLTVRIDTFNINNEVVRIFGEKKESYHADVDDEKTIRYFSKNKGNDFVTGWIVCVKGPERGRAYELHYGFNRIGRNPEADIFLEEDRQITRGCHCALVYEYKKNVFYLLPEEGNLVYIRDEFIREPVQLETGDVFKVGASEFEFIAFCRGERKWEQE